MTRFGPVGLPGVLLFVLALLLPACRSATPELPARAQENASTPSASLATPLPEQDTSATSGVERLLTLEQQYHQWMAEARAVHPYSEPLETMWAVMICESGGKASLVADSYYGLFQYRADTWSGDWNPYRDQPILDPRAQIFATAKAWQDGNQSWWGCYSHTEHDTGGA